MSLRLNGIKLPLNLLTKTAEFTVVGQSRKMKYANGQSTDEVEAVKLELFDPALLERITVQIPETYLPFDAEKVEAHEIKVSLVNATFTFYVSNTGQLSVSIKAEGFKEVQSKSATVTAEDLSASLTKAAKG